MVGTEFSEGLYEFMDSYDGFIIDQWGVLHDGVKPYEGVINALTQLKANKKEVIVLSNSGKRSDYNMDRMKEMGFKPSYFHAVVSAGEVTWTGLKEQSEAPFKGLGKKCYLICRGKDQSLLEGLDLEVVENIEDAEFILVTGVDAEIKKLEDFEEVFRKGVGKGLHLICANPDLITIFKNERAMGPGAVAKKYQDLGGVAHFIGKPHAPILKYCQSLFKKAMPARTLVIGDSLSHDILGANAIDIDSMFILGGLHSSAFKVDMPMEIRKKNLEQLIQNYGARPRWVMESLIWQSSVAALRERDRARMRD